MSHSDVPDDAGDQSLGDAGIELQDDPDGSQADVTAPAPARGRQRTGDEAVDDVLRQLDEVADEPLDTQIEVGERVHRVLQGRLADLGKE